MSRRIKKIASKFAARSAIILLVLFFPHNVMAETFCVATASELSLALFESQANGEDDTIQIVQGTYTGTFSFTSNETFQLSLMGGYDSGCMTQTLDPANTVLDAEDAGSVFQYNALSSSDLTITGISFQNGDTSSEDYGGGLAIFSNEGDVTLTSIAVSGCHATSSGGAGYFFDVTNLAVNDSSIENNTAGLSGTGGYGAGLFIQQVNSVSISNTRFTGNDSDRAAAIYMETVDNATITGNTIDSNPGGAMIFNAKSVTIEQNTISNNDAGNFNGGGLYANISQMLTFNRNTVTGNQANIGAGIYCANAPELIMERNIIFGNDAGRQGGGLYSIAAYNNVTITNNLIAQNRSGGSGHGIYMEVPDSVTLMNNTIADNTTMPGGVGGPGGGLYLVLYRDSDTAMLYNNIFYSNSATTCNDMYIDSNGNQNFIYSPVTIDSNDFDQSSDGFCISQSYPIDPSNLDMQNPLFVDSINGNYRLGEGSPCVDMESDLVSAPVVDLDGVTRPVGAKSDMGAYESVHSCTNDPVMTGMGTYSAIQTAYDAAMGDFTLMCTGVRITGDVDFDQNYTVDFQGGYLCDYSGNSLWGYMTILDGVFTISNGQVVVVNLIIE